MVPITELRGSIPIGVGLLKMPVWSAFLFSVLGSFIIAFILVCFLDSVSTILMSKTKWGNKFFTWLFDRTRKRFEKKYHKYGNIALMLFVAIPLPVTGAWTGAAAAFLFGIPRKKAILYITLGSIIAGVIVSLITIGGVSLF